MLQGLYNYKLKEYREHGIKENPAKLLAMLLLPQKDLFEPLMVAEGKFYEAYKEQIDKEIQKVETDFEFTREELIQLIEKKGILCNNFEEDKIWFLFAEGFGAMHWGIMYHKEKNPEEIFQEYFGEEPLLKKFSIKYFTLLEESENIPRKFLLDNVDGFEPTTYGLENDDAIPENGFIANYCLDEEEQNLLLKHKKKQNID